MGAATRDHAPHLAQMGCEWLHRRREVLEAPLLDAAREGWASDVQAPQNPLM